MFIFMRVLNTKINQHNILIRVFKITFLCKMIMKFTDKNTDKNSILYSVDQILID